MQLKENQGGVLQQGFGNDEWGVIECRLMGAFKTCKWLLRVVCRLSGPPESTGESF
jgi:hypothetical protein